MEIKKKELLKSPVRKWDETSRPYNAILLVPAGTKHSSGFMHVAVIGVYVEDEKEKYEICAFPDDISCYFPIMKLGHDMEHNLVRMDCYYPQGVLRYHGDGKFFVGPALSSVDIRFISNSKAAKKYI